MNRQLKFRIWDSKNHKILKDFEIDQYCESGTYLNHVFCYDDRFVFQQFTGLTDKNRKEIYEGDILEIYKKNKQYKYDYSFRMNYIQNPEKKEKWDYIKTTEETHKWKVFFGTIELCDEYSINCTGWMVKNLDNKYTRQSLDDLINGCETSDMIYYNVLVESDYKVIGNIFENPELLNPIVK